MVNICFVGDGGEETRLNLADGQSLMEAAVHAGIDGIDADCGGQLACATCHVVIAPEWFERLPAATPDERDMLGYVAVPADTSRLSCQIRLAPELDGLIVAIPARQS